MQKFLLSIIAFFYLVSTSGIVLRSHFCMGKLKSTTISLHQQHLCSFCGMESGNSHCCHDESKWYKVNDNHHSDAVKAAVPAPFSWALPAFENSFSISVTVFSNNYVFGNHSPPLLHKEHSPAMLSVFRI